MLVPTAVGATGNKPWEEYAKLLESRRSIAALDADKMFGEELDLYSGNLSFTTTDISLKGNNGLPVELRRKFDVLDTIKQRRHGGGLLGDWQVELPHISGIFASPEGWHANRCTQPTPPTVTRPASPALLVSVSAIFYWAGNQAHMPGGGEMLTVGAWPRPQTTSEYRWVTASNTHFSCIASIPAGGEGFVGITADGTTYRFDHMATQPEMTLSVNMGGNVSSLNRIRVSLFATLVTDRFGNSISYSYANSPNQPVRVSKIASRNAGSSSDDRVITLQYDANGRVERALADGEQWIYSYANGSLSSVTLPDLSKWEIGFSSLKDARIVESGGDLRKCQTPNALMLNEEFSGWLKHPSGARATYTVGPRRFGRWHVPLICNNYQPPATYDEFGEGDDYPVAAIQAWQLTLLGRQINGPGIPDASWSYEWLAGPGSWSYRPGQSTPVCTTDDCLEALCTSAACARSRTLTVRGPDNGWVRYTHGSTYRYNEGLLLSVATGRGSTTLRTVAHAYDHGTTAQAYASRIGTSPQGRGAAWVSEAVRPKISTVTMQDGAEFAWTVNKNCWHPDAYCLDVFAQPTRVTRSGTVVAPQQGATVSLPPAVAPTVTSPPQSASGAFAVTWNQTGGATGYEAQERQGTSVWTSLYTGSGTSHAVSGRATGDWSYRARACNAAGCTGYSAVSITQVAIPPAGSPVVSAPASNSSGSFPIGWQAVAHAATYEIEQSANGGGWLAIGSISALGTSIDGRPNGTYSFRVRACNPVACSNYSTPVTTVVNLAISQAPTLAVQASVGPMTSVSASWTAVPGATAYRLERNRNGVGWTTRYDGPNTSMSESFGLHGTYQYRVRGYSGSTLGPFSNIVQVYVPPNTDGGGEEDE